MFENYLLQQLYLHPYMQPQDIIKLCYQAAFGAEHLLKDISTAQKYFDAEYESVSAQDIPLYEEISSSICRINLAAWKKTEMPSEWLFRMFLNTASASQNGKNDFYRNLATVETVLKKNDISFTLQEWLEYTQKYLNGGLHSVHHSEIYRKKGQPAYRIVHKRFLRLLPILKKAALLTNKNSVKTIAIDGRAASGKSTLAEDLKNILLAGIIHMDDFFLPPNLRSEERYQEPGGNIHSERFLIEVLPSLSKKNSFTYQKFDCHIMDYNGLRLVDTSDWRVVEGAYSCHPVFGDYADLKVFSDIDSKEQIRRLTIRNGIEMTEIFRTRWIPMEEQYYTYYQILDNADVII